jgi:hypothetical protein
MLSKLNLHLRRGMANRGTMSRKADIAELYIASHEIPIGLKVVAPLGFYTGNSGRSLIHSERSAC